MICDDDEYWMEQGYSEWEIKYGPRCDVCDRPLGKYDFGPLDTDGRHYEHLCADCDERLREKYGNG